MSTKMLPSIPGTYQKIDLVWIKQQIKAFKNGWKVYGEDGSGVMFWRKNMNGMFSKLAIYVCGSVLYYHCRDKNENVQVWVNPKTKKFEVMYNNSKAKIKKAPKFLLEVTPNDMGGRLVDCQGHYKNKLKPRRAILNVDFDEDGGEGYGE